MVVLFLVEADADCLAVGSRWTAALAALADMARLVKCKVRARV